MPEERNRKRFDRCQGYNYVCSAGRTKVEEQSMSMDIVSNTENNSYVDGDQVGEVARSLSLPLETLPLVQELQMIDPVRPRHPVLRFSSEAQW